MKTSLQRQLNYGLPQAWLFCRFSTAWSRLGIMEVSSYLGAACRASVPQRQSHTPKKCQKINNDCNKLQITRNHNINFCTAWQFDTICCSSHNCSTVIFLRCSAPNDTNIFALTTFCPSALLSLAFGLLRYSPPLRRTPQTCSCNEESMQQKITNNIL